VNDTFGLRSLSIDELRHKWGAKWQARPNDYCAWVADMDFPVAPAVRDRLARLVENGELGYPSWGGPHSVSPAAKLFGPRMAERFGWEVDRAHVHDMVDVLQGVRAAVHHLSAPGDGVVLHLPSYHPFLHTIRDLDRRLVPVLPESGREFDYDDLEARLDDQPASVWILCHPHNPLGHVFERDELERIADIAARHDLVVISDEIHADLSFAGHLPFAALSPEASARSITLTSASKAFNLAGLRWAVMHVGYQPFQEILRGLPGHYLGAPNLMAVEATVAAWTDGSEWLDDVVSLLDENRRALTRLVDEHLPGARYDPPEATYLAWIDVSELGLGDEPADVFRARGVELSPGSQFGPPGAGHVRLNFSTSPDVLAATVAAMAG